MSFHPDLCCRCRQPIHSDPKDEDIMECPDPGLIGTGNLGNMAYPYPDHLGVGYLAQHTSFWTYRQCPFTPTFVVGVGNPFTPIRRMKTLWNVQTPALFCRHR